MYSHAGHSCAGAVLLLAMAGISPASAQTAFITNTASNTVSIIDIPSGTVIGAVPVGSEPQGVAVAPNGTTAYVTNLSGPSVSVIDAAQFPAAVKTIKTGTFPSAIVVAPNGTRAYVSNGLSTPMLSVINTANNHVIGNIALPGAPAGVAVAPNGRQIYVANGTTTGAVSVVSAATQAVLLSIPVGASPVGIAVTPNGARAYVTQSLSKGSVTDINLTHDTVTRSIKVGSDPVGIAITPDGTKAFVANHTGNTVSVINTANDRVTATIAVGKSPFGVSFSPDGSQAFVANKTDNTVSQIDVATNAVVATIAVGTAPAAFGNFVGRAQPASSLLAAVLSGASSVQINNTAKSYATIVNTNAADLSNCRILLPNSAAAGLSMIYETTNADGTVTSGPDPDVTIAGNASQSFLLQFTSAKPALDQSQPLLFLCAGTTYAPIIVGVNTVDLQFSKNAAANIDALAVTLNANGIVDVPLSSGQAGGFAVATENMGAAGNLVATTDTGAVALPVTITLCQTSATTGQCLESPASSVAVRFAAGATPTFSVFVTASAPIPLNQETSRIFVRFLDQSSVSHGFTSVAVETD